MQTIAVQIQDNYVQNFMSYVNNHSENIQVSKDKNLEYDPYFYERKKELEKVIEECENGTMEMLSQEQYDNEMKIFFKDLKANANL
jgi:5,10-methylenetetrahydrofolate reductase